jgi:hypothetical protein
MEEKSEEEEEGQGKRREGAVGIIGSVVNHNNHFDFPRRRPHVPLFGPACPAPRPAHHPVAAASSGNILRGTTCSPISAFFFYHQA